MTARLLSLASFILMLALIGSPRDAYCAEHTPSIPSAPAAAALPSEAPPADSSEGAAAKGSDNRWRFQLGMMKVPADNHLLPTANVNYRWSLGLPKGSAAFGIGFTGEIGLTLLLPYAKAGMEIRYRHIFLDAHCGGLVVPMIGGSDIGLFPMPFAGGDVGYLFNIGSMRMELEAGYNFIGEGGYDKVGIAYTTIAMTW